MLLVMILGVSIAFDPSEVSDRMEGLRACVRQSTRPYVYRENGALIVPDSCYGTDSVQRPVQMRQGKFGLNVKVKVKVRKSDWDL